MPSSNGVEKNERKGVESKHDMLSRVALMADPDQATWDLSENDQAAIQYVLAELASLRVQLGEAVHIARAVASEDCESMCGVTGMKHACYPKRARAFLEAASNG